MVFDAPKNTRTHWWWTLTRTPSLMVQRGGHFVSSISLYLPFYILCIAGRPTDLQSRAHLFRSTIAAILFYPSRFPRPLHRRTPRCNFSRVRDHPIADFRTAKTHKKQFFTTFLCENFERLKLNRLSVFEPVIYTTFGMKIATFWETTNLREKTWWKRPPIRRVDRSKVHSAYRRPFSAYFWPYG